MLNYLGTVSIDRNITCHLYDRMLEVRSPSRVHKMTITDVNERLSYLLTHDMGQITIGHWSLTGKEVTCIWNIMLAYLGALGVSTDKYTDARSYEWEKRQGIHQSAEPMPSDDM